MQELHYRVLVSSHETVPAGIGEGADKKINTQLEIEK
jgi:hypothetical protein